MQLRQQLNVRANGAGRRTSSRRSAVRISASLQQHRAAPGSQGQSFTNQLEQLKMMSVVVADTGEPALVRKYKPQDCTTNPSLVLKATQSPEYSHILGQALRGYDRTTASNPQRPYADVADQLAVNLGAEMLRIVPGRVSTEVDAHLSFDTKATYDKALRLVDLYAKKGIDHKRVYIKIASTWEGIEACRKLQRQGIDTNMTLLFSFAQAAACADAGASLISPFVGRILDWHKAKHGRDYSPEEDPGVLSVRRIYIYFKTHGYRTIVMAASFRNVGEIRALAGCDNITIAPSLLAELEAAHEPLPRVLLPSARDPSMSQLAMSKATFDALHNQDQMAVDKLASGIEGFAVDQRKLETLLAAEAEKLHL